MVMRIITSAAAALIALSGVAQAQDAAQAATPSQCTYTSNDTEDLTAMLRERGATVDDFDTFCAGLNAARMGVDSNGYASVGDGSTTAVVLLRLYDLEGGTRGAATTFGFVNVAGEDEAARFDALSGAYNNAIGTIASDLNTYIASVVEDAARLDGLYRAGVPDPVLPPAEPCQITYRAVPEIEEKLAARGALPDFAGYDAFCQALRARAVGLEFAGASMMVGSDAHSWASVGVYDLATEVTGNAVGFSLSVTLDAGEAVPADDLLSTLASGLEGLAANTDVVLSSLASVVARDRAFYPVGD